MKTDLEKLQGCWNVITVEVEGQKFPASGAQIVITGDRFVSLNMGAEFAGLVTFDETSTPKTFALLYDAGPHAGKASLGIYELSDDEWKICMGFAGSGRPADFVSKPGTGYALETLRRDKPAPAKVPEPQSTTPTQLEGEWAMKSCIQDGQPLQKNYAAKMRRMFEGSRTTLYYGAQPSSTSSFRLNGGQIDYVDLDQTGIYELTGKTLKIAMAERGGKRPEDFSAAPGDRRTVTEWKRSEPRP